MKQSATEAALNPVFVLLALLACMAASATQVQALSGDTVADRELGQFDMFHNGANTVDLDVMNQPNQIALDRSVVPNRLYVADTQNSRILGYHSVAALVTGSRADIVVGQRDFYSSGCNNPVLSFSSLCNASGIAVDSAGNLYVADNSNNRVLEFSNPFTTMSNTGMTAGFPAIVVVGQGGNFRSNACNLGGSGPTAANLCNPIDVALDSGRNLYVTDYSNNRVLEYNAPLSSSSVAARVFGQLGNFKSGTANNGGVTAASLNGPKGIAVDPVNNSLYLADNGNSRVLRYNTPLTSQTANLVFGQGGSFSQNSCNLGGVVSANTLCGNFFTSLGVTVDASENVFIADFGNNRVLEYKPPIAANPAASMVFGQTSFTTNACNLPSPPTAKTMCSPISAAVDNAKNLWVSDIGNNRVVAIAYPFSPPPTSAAVVLGQPDAVHDSPNSVDASGLYNPAGIAIDSANHLYVADYNNSRVLGYTNATSFANNAPANLVIGQPDFYSSGCNQNNAEGPNTLCNPQGVALDKSGNLYVADYSNSRVLKFTPPFASGHVANQSASVVLGQSVFTTHNNVTSVNGMNNPTGVALDGSGRLYVADRFNNRVLQFVPPFVSGQGASMVIGQASFTAGACNRNGSANKTTLCSPIGAALDSSGNLYVADEANSRVLEYSAPLTTGEGAALVFGQLGSFTTTGCNDIPTGLNANSLCAPQGVTVDAANDVYIADSFAGQGDNNRVLKYYTPLLKTAKAGSGDTTADRVFGQADNFTSNLCNFGGTTPSARSLCNPYAVALDSLGDVYISDYFNNRVLEYDVP